MTDQEKINFIKAAIQTDATLIIVLREIISTSLESVTSEKLDSLVQLLGVQ